ncbi:MAG: DUF1569 domain-containing protein [Vicinamibacterales bacterium]
MENLFNAADRDAMLTRLAALEPDRARRWGTMALPQMLAHCTVGFQYPLGEKTARPPLAGRLLAPLIKGRLLGPKPFGRNGRTGADFVIRDQRDFDVERARLHDYIVRFCAEGRGGVNNRVHAFFGPLTGDEWGRLMFKHLDHHLRQFGA